MLTIMFCFHLNDGEYECMYVIDGIMDTFNTWEQERGKRVLNPFERSKICIDCSPQMVGLVVGSN